MPITKRPRPAGKRQGSATETPAAASAANGSDKRAKFVELVQKRVPKVRTAIRVLRNLTNANAYQFTETDWKRILGTLRSDLDDLERLSKSRKAGKEDLGFTLEA